MESKPFKEGTMAALFLELAQPDEDGFSREVSIEEFKGKYSCLVFGNGNNWGRKGSALAKRYNIKRIPKKGKIFKIKLNGYKKIAVKEAIPAPIKKEVKKGRCLILDTGKPECDHKDGRKDDPRFNNPDKVTIDDFQPLSKPANNAKREHCKKCKANGKRFDATRLGYSVKQYKGDEEYDGSCVGCYWYDPKAFNEAVSKDFEKKN